MRIKKGEWIINSKSLFRIEWRKYYPVLIIHEKYEKAVKWIIRIFTIIGIAISVITMPWFLSLIVAIILLGIDLFLENVIFLYTTIVMQEPPDFDIKHGMWRSNLFLLPRFEGDLPFFCLGFTNKEYAEKLFDYFLSWNTGEHIDKKNIITLNWTLNKNGSYVTEIFANPRRENLDEIYNEVENKNKLEKYGKKQQRFVAQISFGQKFKTSKTMQNFISNYKQGSSFYFAPALVADNGKDVIEILNKRAILKNTYNLKKN